MPRTSDLESEREPEREPELESDLVIELGADSKADPQANPEALFPEAVLELGVEAELGLETERQTRAAYTKSYEAGIRALSRRDHGETELRRKLQRKFADAPEANEAALKRLKQQNFLSDERFVSGVIRGRIGRGYGPYYIRRELISKGVTSELVDQQIKVIEHDTEIDWFSIAGDLVERRFTAVSEDPKVWMKAVRFLQRRGFSADVVQEAVGAQPRESR